jgi:hypothetical protein
VDAITKPWKAIKAQLRGPRTTGPMAPEIDLSNQRKAEFSFSRHVEQAMSEMAHEPPAVKRGAKHGGTGAAVTAPQTAAE